MVQRIVHAYEYEISTKEMDTLVAVLIEDLSKTGGGLEKEFKKIAAYGLIYEVKSSTHQKNKKTPKIILNKEALNELLQDYKSKYSLTERTDYLEHFYTLAPLEEDLEEDFSLNANQNSSVDAYHSIVLGLNDILIEINKRLTEEQAEAFFTTAKEIQLGKVLGQFEINISPNLSVINRDKFKTLKQKLKEELIAFSLTLKKVGVADRPLVASETLDEIVDKQLKSNNYKELTSATQLVLQNTFVPKSEKALGGNEEYEKLTVNEKNAVDQIIGAFNGKDGVGLQDQARKYNINIFPPIIIGQIFASCKITDGGIKVIRIALSMFNPTNNIEINKGKSEQKIDTISLLKTEKVSGSSSAYEKPMPSYYIKLSESYISKNVFTELLSFCDYEIGLIHSKFKNVYLKKEVIYLNNWSNYKQYNSFLDRDDESFVKEFYKKLIISFKSGQDFLNSMLVDKDFIAFIQKAKNLGSNPIRVRFLNPLSYNSIEKINTTITMAHFVFEIRTKDINFTKLENTTNKFEISFLTELSKEDLSKEELSKKELLDKNRYEILKEMLSKEDLGKKLSEKELLKEKELLETTLFEAELFIGDASRLIDFNIRDKELSEIKCIYFPLPKEIEKKEDLKDYLMQKTFSYSKGPNIPMQYYFKEKTFIHVQYYFKEITFDSVTYVLPWLYCPKPTGSALKSISGVFNPNSILSYLLTDRELKININEKNYSGLTALMHLLKNKHELEMIKVLLRNKAGVNVKDNEGQTALMYALIYNYSIKTFRLLLDNNADINAKDNLGRTALMLAVIDSEYLNAKYFVSKGADIYSEDKLGNTCLTYAEKGSKDKIINLLKDKIKDDLERDKLKK
jgi:ankyrin repeat protein